MARSLTGSKVPSSKATLEEVLKEEPDVFETWVKRTEEEAWVRLDIASNVYWVSH